MQARRHDQRQWTTLGIGKPLPEFELDKNQFPGARLLQVRILRNTGLSTEVIDQQEIAIE